MCAHVSRYDIIISGFTCLITLYLSYYKVSLARLILTYTCGNLIARFKKCLNVDRCINDAALLARGA